MRPTFRLLPLSLAAAALAAPPAHAADSHKPLSYDLCPAGDVIPPFDNSLPKADNEVDKAKLRAERENEDTVITANQQSGTATEPEYNGAVELHHGDQSLYAEHLQANQDTGDYEATGSVHYQDTDLRAIAERVHGNQNTNSHQIDNVQYQLVSKRGNGTADSARMQDAIGNMYGATYTTCDPSDRRWELKARRIDIDNDTGWGIAHGASVLVGDTPIFYFPWFKFPVDDRRHTGFLYPDIGLSNRNGLDYQQPFYWNIAPNYDATFTPREMTNRGEELSAQFRYMYEGGKGVLTGSWIPHDDLVEERIRNTALPTSDSDYYNPYYDPMQADNRGLLKFVGTHNIDQNWQVRANLIWISDPRFPGDSGTSVYGSSASALDSTIGVYGQGRYWSAGLMADNWQSADYTVNDDSLPYNRQPRLYVNWQRPYGNWISTGVSAEVVRFAQPDEAGGERLDVKPSISMPLQGAAWFITPTLAYRYTAYQLDPELADQIARQRAATALGIDESAVTAPQLLQYRDERPTRSMPIGSLDMGLYFDRDVTLKDGAYLNTLEPRLFYLNAPYRDQDALPVFDTRAFTFSWGQLFRDNRYTSADRQTDANQLTTAVSSRWLRQRDGHEKFSISLGQIRYFEDSRVQLPSDPTPIQRGRSAWVIDTSYAPNDRWTFNTNYQWNPKYRQADVVTFRSRYLFPADGVINLNYRYQRNTSDGTDQLKQADFSFLYPVSPSWSLVGRYYYSLVNNKPLEVIAGAQWDSCCMAVRFLARRYVHNVEGELGNQFGVEFVLKGLGGAGRDSDRVLRRAILGYDRDDLYLVPPSNTTLNPDDDGDSSPDLLP